MRRMRRIGFVVVLGVLVLALGGCNIWPYRKPVSPLVGIWINRLGAVWTMNDDGTFDVDLTHDGKPDTRGTWSAEGDLLRLKLSPGRLVPDSCIGEGVYRFTRTGPELAFKLVHDDCKLRRTNIVLGWRMKH